MNRYALILEEWERVVSEEKQLEEEYQGQRKGDVYLRRKLIIERKKDDLRKKVLLIGTQGIVCKISGKRSRPSIKNPRVLINERFNLFFVNVTEEEVGFLIKMHVKNMVQYKVEFFKPGMVLTTD